MRRIHELTLDGQAFSEAVPNAFKPFPDAFLARLYARASDSLGLGHFNRSIKEKLNLLNTLSRPSRTKPTTSGPRGWSGS